ncbi:hypothetical protein PGT21_027036 [Puccinia graminis f. sp. tritici]|uniref:Uncharacterized protein n=1 Tax=Puccinia graminis f. sp. tritici TaxID=56615 RepID=A0A5B0QJL6_PUCGR|nr:hypothetical protein PGT21_027036 [Puccinia graminis f. sp. tritici]
MKLATSMRYLLIFTVHLSWLICPMRGSPIFKKWMCFCQAEQSKSPMKERSEVRMANPYRRINTHSDPQMARGTPGKTAHLEPHKCNECLHCSQNLLREHDLIQSIKFQESRWRGKAPECINNGFPLQDLVPVNELGLPESSSVGEQPDTSLPSDGRLDKWLEDSIRYSSKKAFENHEKCDLWLEDSLKFFQPYTQDASGSRGSNYQITSPGEGTH